jgi:hypothetical protein
MSNFIWSNKNTVLCDRYKTTRRDKLLPLKPEEIRKGIANSYLSACINSQATCADYEKTVNRLNALGHRGETVSPREKKACKEFEISTGLLKKNIQKYRENLIKQGANIAVVRQELGNDDAMTKFLNAAIPVRFNFRKSKGRVVGKLLSPSQKKRSPSQKKRSPSQKKRSPSQKKRSPPQKKRSPPQKKRSPSQKKRSPPQKKRSPSQKKLPY